MTVPKKLIMQCGHHNCVYAQQIEGRYGFCAYILQEHEKRGCKADKDCTRYIKGRRKKIVNYETNMFTYEIETELEDNDEYDY